jgi:5-methylthioadenosine/S-adenosylhomocysteine deaminase
LRILIRGGDVITADSAGTVHADGAVLTDGARIAAAGPRLAVQAAAGPSPDLVIDARGGLIIPGLVDVHVHLAESLMRHAPGDVDLPAWVQGRLRPYEAALSPERAGAAAELALLELTLAGVTTVAESLLPPGGAGAAVAAAAARSGLRTRLAVASGGPHDGPGFAGFERIRADWQGHAGRLDVGLAPRPLPQVTPAFLAEAARYARAEGTWMSSHFANSSAQRDWFAAELGRTPAQAAADLGLLWPGHLLGHCTWLGDGDIDLIAGAGAPVAHLPATNLRLGMGVMPLTELRAAGVTVGLGTDGDNAHDLLDTARLAVSVQRLRSGPAAVTAPDTVAMLTIEGARALGIDGETGSIEAGKRADIAVLSADGPHLAPGRDPLRRLAQAARASDVRTVLVDGELVLDHGRPARFDAPAVIARAQEFARGISFAGGGQ